MHHKRQRKKLYDLVALCLCTVTLFCGCHQEPDFQQESSFSVSSEESGRLESENINSAHNSVVSSAEEQTLSFSEPYVLPRDDLARKLTGRDGLETDITFVYCLNDVFFYVLTCREPMAQFSIAEYVIYYNPETKEANAVFATDLGEHITKMLRCEDELYWSVMDEMLDWKILKWSGKQVETVAAAEQEKTYTGPVILSVGSHYVQWCEFTGESDAVMHLLDINSGRESILSQQQFSIENLYWLPTIQEETMILPIEFSKPARVSLYNISAQREDSIVELKEKYAYGYFFDYGLLYLDDYSGQNVFLCNPKSGREQTLFSSSGALKLYVFKDSALIWAASENLILTINNKYGVIQKYQLPKSDFSFESLADSGICCFDGNQTAALLQWS